MITFGVAALLALTSAKPREHVVTLDRGILALSTRGSSAFRVRFLASKTEDAFDSPMVAPRGPDAPFSTHSTGIMASFGSMQVSPTGELVLLDAAGTELTRSAPITATDMCASQPGTDGTGGERAAVPLTVANESACCAACTAQRGCVHWIFGHPGDEEGNCWLMRSIGGTVARADRTLGGRSVRFSARTTSKLYGGGGDKSAVPTITRTAARAYVDNTKVGSPQYYSSNGYAALAAANTTTGSGKTNELPVSFTSDDSSVTWTCSVDGPFELYLMPAATLDLGTAALYDLIGPPAVPPRYAFGFIASRWGWQNRSYIEDVLHAFRNGSYPIDAFIGDFGWFTNISDYRFPPTGVASYHDFGYNNVTFPQPAAQLASYRRDLHFHMGGIRKPRLGNVALLDEARAKHFLLPGGEVVMGGEAAEAGQVRYAEQRNLNFSMTEAREWYAEKQAHYLSDGVSFFWNDEGETDYFTFYWWNVAQAQTLTSFDPSRRFYSINRAWSPGMARLGATVWTGDIDPSWQDLSSTPAMLLNWGLSGAPYVACDIGGFTGQTNGPLLTRWMQLGTFLPMMRIHSTLTATPHFPWLWGEPYASLMRAALELRYQLLPYHYSLAHAMYSSSKLWMRPVAAAFPDDAAAASLASQWLDGSLLVAPVLRQDSQRDIYLPNGTWYRFNSTATVTGPTTLKGTASLSEVPVFSPPGAIIPLADVVQHTGALPGGPLTVQVYGGADGKFELVEDDGESTAYKSSDGTRRTAFVWDDAAATLSWSVSGAVPSKQMFVALRLSLLTRTGRSDSEVKPIGTGGSIQAPPVHPAEPLR